MEQITINRQNVGERKGNIPNKPYINSLDNLQLSGNTLRILAIIHFETFGINSGF